MQSEKLIWITVWLTTSIKYMRGIQTALWLKAETIKKNIQGGDRQKLLLQRETFYIHQMKATAYPALNEVIDFSAYL